MAANAAKHLQLGAAGEEAAARHIRQLGWIILHRNWRPRGAAGGLELDLVARQSAFLVFLEVKTRALPKGRIGNNRKPERERGIPVYAAFTPRKRIRMARAAEHYLTEQALWSLPCRFDLICVEVAPDGNLALEHITHVMEFGNLVDRGNTSWQPW